MKKPIEILSEQLNLSPDFLLKEDIKVYVSDVLTFADTLLAQSAPLTEPQNEPDRAAEMEYASDIFCEAKKYGMEIEVVVWALDAMKCNPGLSIQQALKDGFDEWVK